MKKMIFKWLLIFSGFAACLQAGDIHAQATDTLMHAAVLPFAPGEIPATAVGSAAPAFTPDGKIVIIGQSTGSGNITIMESHLEGKSWSALNSPTFSGTYRDLEPAFSSDGKYVIFASNRPAESNDSVLNGHYNGQVLPGGGGNLWKVKYSKRGWGTPEVLPEAINSNTSIFSPAIARDGSLYFMRADSGKKFHIYRAQMHHGKFEPPVAASFTDYRYGDYDPAIAPDESFIIFASPRPPAPAHTADLFIAFRTNNGWGQPIDLRTVLSADVHGVEARLSPDHKTLYFTNSRNPSGEKVTNGSYTWKVDISGLLKAHGIE